MLIIPAQTHMNFNDAALVETGSLLSARGNSKSSNIQPNACSYFTKFNLNVYANKVCDETYNGLELNKFHGPIYGTRK